MFVPIIYNADRETLAEGKLRTRFGGGWRNYLTARGEWRKMDFAFASDSGRFSIATAPYLLDCPAVANQPIRFESTSRYDPKTKSIRTDAAKGLTKAYHSAAAVGGEVTAQGVLYRDAFPGLNASLLIQPSPRGAKMLTVFHAEPPGSEPVEIPFTLDAGTEKPLTRTLTEPDLRTRQFLDAGLIVGQDAFRRVTLERPMAWDSGRGRRRRRVPVRLRVELVGGQIVCTKIIPRAFFRGATYPVFTDTTSTFTPSRDGSTERSIGGTEEDFSTIRAGNGTYADEANNYNYLQASYVNAAPGFAILARNPSVFDTSAIPDGDNVTDAELTLTNQGDSADVASQSCCLCEGLMSSPIDATDYENNINQPEVAGNRISIADFISNGDGTFTGITTSHINKTGETEFCYQLSCDVDNSTTGFSLSSDENPIFSHYTSEDATEANRPTLVVEHTGGGQTADVPAAVISVTGIAPSTSKSAAVPIGLADLLGVAPTTRISAAVAVGSATVTGIAPTASKAAAVVTGPVDVTGIPPTTSGLTGDVPAGAVDVTGTAPGSSKSAAVTVGPITVTGQPLTAAKSAGVEPGPIDVTGVAPATSKSAAAAIGQIEVVGLPPVSALEADIPAGPVDVAGVAPTASKAAAMTVGQINATGIAPGSSKSASVAVGEIDVTGIPPGTAKSAAMPNPGLIDVLGIPLTASFQVAVGVGLVDVLGLAPGAAKSAGVVVGLIVVVGTQIEVDSGVTHELHGRIIARPTMSGYIEAAPRLSARILYRPRLTATLAELPR